MFFKVNLFPHFSCEHLFMSTSYVLEFAPFNPISFCSPNNVEEESNVEVVIKYLNMSQLCTALQIRSEENQLQISLLEYHL
jgi:hypothetical protein